MFGFFKKKLEENQDYFSAGGSIVRNKFSERLYYCESVEDCKEILKNLDDEIEKYKNFVPKKLRKNIILFLKYYKIRARDEIKDIKERERKNALLEKYHPLPEWEETP